MMKHPLVCIVFLCGCLTVPKLLCAAVDGEVHMARAVEALAAQDILLALQEYHVATSDSAVTRDAYRGLVETRLQYVGDLISESRFESAGSQLRKARIEVGQVPELTDSVADQLMLIAEHYAGEKDYVLAIRYMKKAVDLMQGDVRMRDRLLEIYENAADRAVTVRNYKRAQKYAKEGLEYDDQKTRLYEILGTTYYRQQNFIQARKSWESARHIIVTNNGDTEFVDQKLSGLTAEEKLREGRKVRETSKFSIVIDDDVHRTGIAKVKKQLRAAYDTIARDLKYYPSDKIPVEIYSGDDFSEAIGPRHVYIAGQYDGSVRVPASYNITHPAFFKGLLCHEVAHAFIHDMSARKCPRWLNEGIAEVQEKKYYRHRLSALREAMRQNTLLTMRELMAWEPVTNEHRTLYYEQAYSMTKYLVKKYRWSRITRLMGDIRDDVDFAEAFKTQYRMDFERFEQLWRRHIRTTLR